MAFRKRTIPLRQDGGDSSDNRPRFTRLLPGVRASPLTAQVVTSTGTLSLDNILGGHSGLALGSSLLIEENGTTDFAGALLRFYAAEGICQGHVLHIFGVGEEWTRSLPGRSDETVLRKSVPSSIVDDKMKIAWRYQNIGQPPERAHLNRSNQTNANDDQDVFCHVFDLSKRLTLPSNANINYINVSASSRPFDSALQNLRQYIQACAPASIHRLIIPSILSPALWPLLASHPANFLRFLHSLRALLRQHESRLTAMITLPLDLYPRATGLVRWAELLTDGVIELIPFPHAIDPENSATKTISGSQVHEEQPQGMVKVHKIPITTERGEGGAGIGNCIGEDLAFTLSRRKFMIRPFALPPIKGDREAQEKGGKLTSRDTEF